MSFSALRYHFRDKNYGGCFKKNTATATSIISSSLDLETQNSKENLNSGEEEEEIINTETEDSGMLKLL